MSKCYKKFEQNDIFYNQIKAHPENEFFIANSTVYHNRQPRVDGFFSGSVPAGIHAVAEPDALAKPGNISLYEYNVDREGNVPVTMNAESIYPFITKAGSLMSFKTISHTSFNRDFAYGDLLVGEYPLSASVHRRLYSHTPTAHDDSFSDADFHDSSFGRALKNSINNYKVLSPKFDFDRFGSDNDGTGAAVNLISIPSIFFGSSIKRGSVDLRYYITGTLVARLQDNKRNGELWQTSDYDSGATRCAGLVLYNEGFIILTGSWELNHSSELDYNADGTAVTSSWLYFGTGMNDGIPRDAQSDDDDEADRQQYRNTASFHMSFEGTTYTPVVTMMAHAEKGRQNHSNNPTYIMAGQSSSLTPDSSSYRFQEKDLEIKNTISSSYEDPGAPFEKQTFISKIGIYDEQQNLIAVASLANPVKKKEDQDYTFKLKVDI
jgi:hypothetical protein